MKSKETKQLYQMRLDDQKGMPSFDPTNLIHRISDLSSQCLLAWQQSRLLQLSNGYSSAKEVAIVGMGGSAIAGDLLKDLLRDQTNRSISVIRNRTLPAWIDKNTLVIAVSYSGNTKETLSAFNEAINRGCQLISSTSGGLLQQRSQILNIPIVSIDFVGEPRSAIGYGLLNLLSIFDKLKFIPRQNKFVIEAIKKLALTDKSWNNEVPTNQNYAKQLAIDIGHNIPIIIGSGLFTSAAQRWKTQFNENSKALAMWETVPESEHNTIESFSISNGIDNSTFPILLEHHPRISRDPSPFRKVKKVLEVAKMPYALVKGPATNNLSQLLWVIHLGDYISYYLAVLRGVDPSPVPNITKLKVDGTA